MDTLTFKIKWPSGKEVLETVSDCPTVEHFINRRFGTVDIEEHGVTVELVTVTEEQIGFPVPTGVFDFEDSKIELKPAGEDQAPSLTGAADTSTPPNA